jgi:hypothetical protein
MIGRIYGCYVNDRTNIVCQWDKSALQLEDDEIHKYAEMFRAALSGKLGVKLQNLEMNSDVDTKPMMAAVKNDKKAITEMFQDIIDTYDTCENFVILYMTNTYDVPVKTSDNCTLDDSESVYDFGICAICPVKMTKPGLAYDHAEHDFSNAKRSWMLQKPAAGFLYPSFSDRTSNIHEALLFAKKDMPFGIIEDVLHCNLISGAEDQKQFFVNNMNQTTLSIEQVADITSNLQEVMDENAQINKEGLMWALNNAEVDTTELDKAYDESFGDQKISPNAFIDNTLKISAPLAKINVDSQIGSRVKYTVIDGQKYIMVPAEGEITVNGITVTSN